ncbi:hypothetical protein AVEN_64900-1 [Araneus ventricosus]|uniref:Uncharacterized protein n=2 Tax=Araneus ventricosus TaxID=182803 RepID=A0A4Y2QEC2_ARAVE|nr:hypothetical protein AVEN_64900-1 [Araneus ventricosus]
MHYTGRHDEYVHEKPPDKQTRSPFLGLGIVMVVWLVGLTLKTGRTPVKGGLSHELLKMGAILQSTSVPDFQLRRPVFRINWTVSR